MGSTAAEAPLHAVCILGSTREGRSGTDVGRWFGGVLAEREDLEATTVDLADFDFPARYPQRPTPEIDRFTAELARAEAFVVITPEYNHSFPASLKQAIDYGYDEWHAKPVGFVSYGYGSRGLYAVASLRTVFSELHAVTMREVAALDLVEPAPDGGRRDRAAHALLDQLTWWGLALRDARATRPYVG
ncbi:NAD(P)H-dependent oxidoreductase [Streptomyces sp. A7024]|uniref:NAD(P)H-dependent oxidoreductase n=1 Tax=Streptomyces coryli TaxID=1128680 RepID=A0A6G4U0H9_9ACTN|nr:NAD(P)H-dependent oxidoreductase [Streptomyces coryli]NGN65654.1 NAD(P)H-dependent oxidoreductase [Streptomyces coryli]